jgi:hypothetical protein
MVPPFARCLVQVLGFLATLLWMTLAGAYSLASADDVGLADRFCARELGQWQSRLIRFDDTLPPPELFGIDRWIAYEENAAFAYAFGQCSADAEAPLPLRFRRVLLIKPRWLLVDDLWGPPGPDERIGRVGWTPEPVAVPADGEQPLSVAEQLCWVDADDPIGDLAAD